MYLCEILCIFFRCSYQIRLIVKRVTSWSLAMRTSAIREFAIATTTMSTPALTNVVEWYVTSAKHRQSCEIRVLRYSVYVYRSILDDTHASNDFFPTFIPVFVSIKLWNHRTMLDTQSEGAEEILCVPTHLVFICPDISGACRTRTSGTTYKRCIESL